MKTNKYVSLLLAMCLMGPCGLLVAAQQRSGGPGQGGTSNPEDEYRREVERYLNLRARERTVRTAPGAWWMDTALVTRLDLSNDQKIRIERIFDVHRQNLIANTMQLEKDELALKQLLEAEDIDRTGVRTQIERVIRSRSEMERTNSTMTLEMREQLTRAQWIQLQASQPSWTTSFGLTVERSGGGARGRRSQ